MRKLMLVSGIVTILACGLAAFLVKGIFDLSHTAFAKTTETYQLALKVDSLEMKIFKLQQSIIILQENQVMLTDSITTMRKNIHDNHRTIERMRKRSQIMFP